MMSKSIVWEKTFQNTSNHDSKSDHFVIGIEQHKRCLKSSIQQICHKSGSSAAFKISLKGRRRFNNRPAARLSCGKRGSVPASYHLYLEVSLRASSCQSETRNLMPGRESAFPAGRSFSIFVFLSRQCPESDYCSPTIPLMPQTRSQLLLVSQSSGLSLKIDPP